MDVFSKRKRSRIMSRIRSSGTKPEVLCRSLFRELTRRPISFNDRSLPGSPDIVVRFLRVAFFLDGCYWHCCPEHGRIPKSNVDFWKKKLARNVARDKRTRRDLRRMGWAVWCVWEHDLRGDKLPGLKRRLSRRLARLEAVSTVRSTRPDQSRMLESEMTTKKPATKSTKKPAAKSTKKAAAKPAKKAAAARKPTAKPAKKATARKPATKKATARKPAVRKAAKPAAPSADSK